MGTLTNPGVNTTTSPRTLPADSFDAASSGPRVLWTGSLDTHHTGFFGHPPHRSPTTQVARQLTLGAGEPHSALVIPAKSGTYTTHGIPTLGYPSCSRAPPPHKQRSSLGSRAKSSLRPSTYLMCCMRESMSPWVRLSRHAIFGV